MKFARTIIALALALSMPLTALAAPPHNSGGGGRGGGGSSHPASRPAPESHPAAPSRPSGGYDLHNDTAPSRPAPSRPAPARPAPQRPGTRPPANHAPSPNYRPPGYRPSRPVVIANPAWRGRGAWYWNRGVQWAPAGGYWGGGFWGAFALGAISAALFGTIYGDGTDYYSYQVAPDSPGAQLLANYQLTQTPCGPPNLVVIYGPDNSVICAYPNDLVGPGTYSVDPSTLTLSSY